MPEIIKLPASDLAPLRLEIPRPRTAGAAKPAPASPLLARVQAPVDAATRPAAAELQQLRDEARSAGFEQGLAQADAQRVEHAKALAGLMEVLSQQMKQHVADIEEAACTLALACMTRLLGEAMATPAGALACVRQVLAEQPELAQAELRVHPADAAAVQSLLGEAGMARWDGLRVVGDPRVALGGCVLRSRRGDLDAGIETLWRDLAATLTASRAAR